MTRKLTAVIVLTCMLFTMLTPCAYAADAPFYKLIAEETISTDDYSAFTGMSTSGGDITKTYKTDPNTGKPVLTGKGWLSNWKVKDADDTDLREPVSGDNIWYYSMNSTTKVVKINNMPSGTFLYRQFAQPFEFGGAGGTYVFSIEVQDGSGAAGGSAFRQKIGEAFVVGYDYVPDDTTKRNIVPVIEVNGEKYFAQTPLTTTHDGNDGARFIVFETTVSLNKSGDDTITVKIYEKGTQPYSTVSTTADLTSLIEYVGMGSTTTTLLRIDNLKVEYSNEARYNEIVNIANNGPTDDAELQAAIADLADYNGDDKTTLLDQLKGHDTSGVADLKLVSITPEVSAPILVNDAKKFELEYNYPFADATVFNIYNTDTNEPITGTVCTVNKNKVTLTYDGTLEGGILYEIRATGTDFKGDTISNIEFSISALPEINVTNGAHYTQGKVIQWAEDGNAEVTALLNGQPIQNGYAIDVAGEYTLEITATKNEIPETVVLNITIDEDFAPVASDVKILGTAGAGNVLEVDFDYYDANGDAEGEHVIVWYRINGSVETEIGYEPTYTIKRDDRNSDIVVGVTPKSKSTINPVGETVFSDSLRCVFVPTDTADDPFYELIAEDTISTDDYSEFENMSINGGDITKTYKIDPDTDKPVITGKGWSANWVAKGAEDLGFRAVTSSDNVLYYKNKGDYVVKLNNMPADVKLYRQLAQPIEFGNTNDKFSFKIDVQDGRDAAGGSKFRFTIGDSIVAGYDYDASDNEKIIPILEVNGAAVPNSDTLTVGPWGDSGNFMTFTVTVELTKDGADTVTLIAHEKGAAANAARVMIATGAELSGECKYVGVGTVAGATTLLRVDNLKIEYSNIGRFYEITDIANNGTTDAAELEAAIADLADYNGADRDEIIAKLEAYAIGDLDGVDDVKPVNISHDINKMLLIRDVNSFEIKYNYKLKDDVTFSIYNMLTNEAVPGVTSEVDGTDVKITLAQKLENGAHYEIRATGTDFKGDPIPVIGFTTSPIPDINIADGQGYSELTEIRWTADENTTVTAVLKDASGNEVAVSNGYEMAIRGDFEFTITATKNDLTDTAVMNITVEEDFAPVASNVKITGVAATDEVLNVEFDVYDENKNDAEGSHIIVWYKNTADGKVEIDRGTTSYTLTEADENSDIIVGVTPVSVSKVNPQGAEAFSEAFKGAYKPVASNAKIAGTIEEGKELEVSYTFSDVNKDEKGTPIVRWFVKGENGDTELNDNITDGKLTITSALFEKYVYAKLTPVSDKKPYNGDEVTTEAVLMPSKPTVSNVRIEGSASVGSVLTAYYSFDDHNLDAEGISKFEWKDSDGNILGTERKLTVTSAMTGKTITVTVIGVSEKTPADSAPATSAAVKISGGSSGGGSGGGGGGGFGYSGGSSGSSSGGGALGGSSGTTKPVTPVTPVVPEKETVFGDVYGHWAQEYVTVLLEKGVVTKDESFRPDDSISRAEVLAMLFRSTGIGLAKYNGAYGDVNGEDWFADYVQTALDEEIISPDDNFRPNDSITREEAAKIIAIMLKLTSENAADFADADTISDWATEYVNAVYEAGIFKGDENGNFNAKGALTRAETATVIFRLLEANVFEDGGAE